MEHAIAPRPLEPTAAGRWGDRYLLVLSLCLLGYALMGRSFAYIGVPPLFIGEALLGAGLLLAIRLRTLDRLGTAGPFWILLALQVLTVVRSVPYLGEFGLDVARDAMLFGYGFYAYVVFALLTERPERVRELIVRYRTFAVVMVALAWLPYLAFRIDESWIPFMPGRDNVQIFEAKGGDLLVHLSGIAAFLILGLRRQSWPLTLGLAATALLVMVSNRGGMIAFVLACGLALLLKPPGASSLRLGVALFAVVVAGLVAVPVMQSARIAGNSRELTVDQIWDPAKSIVGQSDSSTLETAKTRRLQRWKMIADDTAFGDLFWTGHGFGLNLADHYGFNVDEEGSLRSPNNGTMTVLARLGVPGLALWVLLHGWWVTLMLQAWWRARRARQDTWSAVFAFGLCLWVALMVNASFGVYLEGSMGGIWLWTVVGAGLAAVQTARTHPDLFSTPDFGHVPPRTVVPAALSGPAADMLPAIRAAIAATPWTPATAPAAVPPPRHIVPPEAALAATPPAMPWATAPTPWTASQTSAEAPQPAPLHTTAPASPPASPPVEAPAEAPVATVTAPPVEAPRRRWAPVPGGPADIPHPSLAVPTRPAPAPPRPPAPPGLRPTDAAWEWTPTASAWRSS